MRNFLLLTALLFLMGYTTPVEAQFSGGFIAGMNFSKFLGPAELNDQGAEVESYTYKTGFHLGGRFTYSFTDNAGLRTELLYSQKGTDFTFDGQSYWIFIDSDKDRQLYSSGERRTVLKVVSNYMEIPLMAYFRIGRLEISGGGYAAYLFRATGAGEVTYSGLSEGGNVIDPFTIALDFNYFDDSTERTNIGQTQPVSVDGEIIQVPLSLATRYEQLIAPGDEFLNRLDYGLLGGVSIFLNQGLNLGFRVNYGLQDLSNDSGDVSRVHLDEDNNFIFRDDFDQNLTLQGSIGFSF